MGLNDEREKRRYAEEVVQNPADHWLEEVEAAWEYLEGRDVDRVETPETWGAE